MTSKKGIRKKETGNPYNKEHRVDSKLTEADLRTTTIYRILDWYKEGLMRKTIAEILLAEGDYSEELVNELLKESTDTVYEQFSSQSTVVIGLHLKRYDREINSLLNKDYNVYELKIRWKMKSMAFLNALDTMYQKEKLLNLHSKRTIVRFNQRNNINLPVQDETPTYDLSSLTLEEKVDFLTLIEKCSPRNNVNTGVILRERVVEEEETIEIEHEDVTNISKIQQENIIGVDVFPPQAPLTMIDIQEKLRLTLQKQAKKALIAAGSKTIENEREL